jgi:hypothetical protein
MDTTDVFNQLKSQWCSALDFTPAGQDRWAISTPFFYADGDGFPVFLRHGRDRWHLTDDGVAFSHLFFDDVEVTDARLRTMTRLAERSGVAVVDDASGVRLVLDLDADPSAYDLADFLQVIAQLQGVLRSISQERSEQRYRAAVRNQVHQWLDPMTVAFDLWSPDSLGSGGKSYQADLYIESGGAPVTVFAASTDQSALAAALSVTQYRKAHLDFQPLLSFRPDRVSSLSVAKFQDAAEADDCVTGAPQDDFATLRPALRKLGVALK